MEQVNIGVVIMSDGTRTVAEATLIDYDGDPVVTEGNGSAGRDHEDKYSSVVGNKLATARALRSLAAHLERDALGRIKHAAAIRAHRAEIAESKAAQAQDMETVRELLGDVNPWG